MKKTGNLGSRTVAFFLVIAVLIALVAGLAVTGKEAYAADNYVKTVRVAHISDIHVLPVAYANPYSEDFKKDSVSSAKLMAESEAALQTALMEWYYMEDAPQIVILSGDLTSNGELMAHVVIADILKEFTAKMRTREGYEKFQIFVMPGNHDMYNDRAVSYMPTKEELEACGSEEEVRYLMENYVPRSVPTTTSKDIFDIYSDFGYCNCAGRKLGHHDADCGMAEGTVLNFFYESEYWYDNKTTRTVSGDEIIYSGFDVKVPKQADVDAFKTNGKDFEYLAEAGRIGACSYVATLNGVTVIGVDGSARSYTEEKKQPSEGEKRYVAAKSAGFWNETTGGMTTRDQLRWIVDETREEVANENLMLVNCHFNNLPHFDAQDEVISLFVLDNYELYNSTLVPAGIHYFFTGHQHSSDIADGITQDGHVFYDFETGSTISYGSGYRIVEFKQVKDRGEYYEEVKSSMYNLNYNDGNKFNYGEYILTADVDGEEVCFTDPVNPEVFTEPENVNLYPGTAYLSMVKKRLKDADGNDVGLGKYLTDFLVNQLSGVVGNIVNDGLYDTIRSATSGLSGMPYVYNLVGALIDGLEELDMPAFVKKADGTFEITKNAVAGNGLVDVAEALVDYLFTYDFSYGKVRGGMTLNDLFVEIYGGHLSGAKEGGISPSVQPLMEKLYDGTFVRFLLIDLLVDTIIPELDYLFDTPVRYSKSTPALPAGKGIDISDVVNGGTSGMIDSAVKMLFSEDYLLANSDKNGYTSLKIIIGNLGKKVNLLFTDLDELGDDDPDYPLALTLQLAIAAIPSLGQYEKYINMAVDYINEYEEDGKIYDVLKKELLDKYVTDAFCANLGDYVAFIIGSIAEDYMPDGSYWGEGDIMTEFTVRNIKDFNVTTRKSNSSSFLSGKAYRRTVAGKDTLEVTPNEENGLLPSMISVSFNNNLGTEKKIKWYTSIDGDIFNKNAKGKYEFAVPASYIEYSENKDLKDGKKVKATSINLERELATVDFGILYINLSHRYRQYNEHTVTLADLKPGTTYYYRLGNDEYAWTKTYSFTTPADGAFSFMAITDIQGSVKNNYVNSYPNVKKGVDHFGDREIAFIASMGDNVDNGKSILQYTWWLDEQKDVWADNTLVTLAGNHEKKNYSLSSVIAVPDEANVNETGYYYSYDYNYAHFVILDTNDIVDNKLSAKQTEWLKADLKENAENEKTKWTIVMLHKGPYTAGSHAFDADVIGLRAQLTPIFAENGVDLVLQGHDHTYSVSEYIGADGKPVEVKKDRDGNVFNPGGVLYLNLGTMGDKYYDYIYSDEVSIMKRTSVDKKLEKYLTEDGYLELTETPVFADITVDENVLSIKTFTIMDGETVAVDDISLKKGREGVDWSNLTTNQIATIASCAAIVAVVIILCVIAVYARKRRFKWEK